MSYDNSNRIALWVKEKREKETQPHLSGKGETNEPVYASAWFSDDIEENDKAMLESILNRYKSKKPFISISIKSREDASQGVRDVVDAPPARTIAQQEQDSFDSDIAF